MNKEIKKGSVLSYVNILLSVIIGLIYTPILIRCLGQSEYGLYNSVNSIISALSLLNLGLGSGYVHFFSQYKKQNNYSKIYSLSGLFLLIFIALGLVAGALGMGLTFNLNVLFANGLTAGEYEIAKKLMFLLTINMVLFFPSSVFQTIINSEEKFTFLKASTILRTIITPLATIPFLFLGYKSIVVTLITVIVSLLLDIVYVFYVLFVLKHKFVFKNFEKGLAGSLFKYTIFIAIHLIVDQINLNLDKIILGRISGTTETAIYSVGATLRVYFSTFAIAIPTLFIPTVHSIQADPNLNEKEKSSALSDVFVKIGRLQWLIIGIIFYGFVLFGYQFIKVWAGEEYYKSFFVALLLIVPITPDVIQHIGIEIQRAKNKHAFRAFIYLAMAIINAVSSIFLCKLWGAIGAALGTAISFIIVQGVIINIYYKRACDLDIKKFWKTILGLIIKYLPIILIGGFFCLFSFGSTKSLFVSIIIFSIVYVFYTIGCVITKEERNYILKKLHLS